MNIIDYRELEAERLLSEANLLERAARDKVKLAYSLQDWCAEQREKVEKFFGRTA